MFYEANYTCTESCSTGFNIDKLVFNNALNNNHTIKKIIARKLVQVIMLIQNKAMSVIISVFIIY